MDCFRGEALWFAGECSEGTHSYAAALSRIAAPLRAGETGPTDVASSCARRPCGGAAIT